MFDKGTNATNVMRDALGQHDVATVALGAGETLLEELFEEVVMISRGPGYLAAPGSGVIATVLTMIIGIWVVQVYRDITRRVTGPDWTHN